jgi:hypothetical protein
LIAGISITEARRMTPGWIQDMYKIRLDYDIKTNGLMGGPKKDKGKGLNKRAGTGRK